MSEPSAATGVAWWTLTDGVTPALIAGFVAWITTRATIRGARDAALDNARIDLARVSLERHQAFFEDYQARLHRLRRAVLASDQGAKLKQLYELQQDVVECRVAARAWLAPDLQIAMEGAEQAAFMVSALTSENGVDRNTQKNWIDADKERDAYLSDLTRQATEALEAVARGKETP